MAVYEAVLSNGEMARFSQLAASLHWALDHVQGPRMRPYKVEFEDESSIIYSAGRLWAYVSIVKPEA